MPNMEEKLRIAMEQCTDKEMMDTIFDSEEKQFSQLDLSSSHEAREEKNMGPANPEYPNASKYDVMNYNKKEIWIIEELERHEEIVKILKKVHDIQDPWDDDPQYFARQS